MKICFLVTSTKGDNSLAGIDSEETDSEFELRVPENHVVFTNRLHTNPGIFLAEIFSVSGSMGKGATRRIRFLLIFENPPCKTYVRALSDKNQKPLKSRPSGTKRHRGPAKRPFPTAPFYFGRTPTPHINYRWSLGQEWKQDKGSFGNQIEPQCFDPLAKLGPKKSTTRPRWKLEWPATAHHGRWEQLIQLAHFRQLLKSCLNSVRSHENCSEVLQINQTSHMLTSWDMSQLKYVSVC